MFPKIDPTTTLAWKRLSEHFTKVSSRRISSLFEKDKERFDHFSLIHGDILFDYSKNNISGETMSLLFSLAAECRMEEAKDALFNGEKINETENRSVLHTALRNKSGQPFWLDGHDIHRDVSDELAKMEKICSDIHSGKWKGFSGRRIRYIVNIGIGGSDLGPQMVTEALRPYWKDGMRAFFVSNIDGAHISLVLKEIDPAETLFLIASKTFTTQETMTNAQSAKNWFLENGGSEKDIPLHFVALSTNKEAVEAFGIDPANMFIFWDWVGGRYSLWSSIGLSIALMTGFEHFDSLLAGAYFADTHFREMPPEKNIPVIMALIGIWHRNFWNMPTEAILPYDQMLHRFPAYFQQGNMESNGKQTDRNGNPVSYATGPVIWGEPGTNGQHAFYQLLHQGTTIIPCDFIAPAQSHYPLDGHHDKLISNFLAQTEALMKGATNENPYRYFPGNRPTNSFLIRKITPFTLGQLIAYYEHKIFVQGVIWNIFSFDQWGVELGKQLAGRILPELSNTSGGNHDSSTNGLMNAFKQMRN